MTPPFVVLASLAGSLAGSMAGSMDETLSSVPLSGVEPTHYPGILLFAVLLSLLHLLAPRLQRLVGSHEEVIGALGAGMAIAYVFLHLIPELSEGNELLGRWIFAVPLASFLLVFGLVGGLKRREQAAEVAAQSAGDGERAPAALFLPGLVSLWVYNWLIVYAAPLQLAESGLRGVPITLMLGVHLVHADLVFRGNHTLRFDRVGRFVLALAPLAGWALLRVDHKSVAAVADVAVAALAGMLLYSTFALELPSVERSRFGWFVTGAVLFAVVTTIAVR